MIESKIPEEANNFINILCSLTPRQKSILECRYCKRMSKENVAKLFKLTPERIRQIEEEAIQIIINKD